MRNLPGIHPVFSACVSACIAASACAPPRSNPLDPKANAQALPATAPVIAPLSPPPVAEGHTLVLVVAVADADGDAVTVAATNLPVNATMTGAVLRFSPDYSQAGQYPITITASDGLSSSSTEVLLVVEENADGGCIDGDGDGHAATNAAGCASGDDCADSDPAVHPGAVEIACNGIDDDCDPATPDDPDPVDADGDGVTRGCGDCDDTTIAVRPGVGEITCDRIDNDCDPATLDNPDRDGDLFGVCVDCNDGDRAIHPRALERCNGSDDDCDGGIDEGC